MQTSQSKCWLFLSLAPVLLFPTAMVSQSAYQTGTLLGIEKKVKITPLTYVYEVVVSYYETVTYELQIQVGDQVYFTDYTPDIQPNGPLPTEWIDGHALEIRTDKHRLLVKLSYGGEIATYIAHRQRAKTP